MHPLLNVAVMAARRAGSALIKKMVNLDKLKIEVQFSACDLPKSLFSTLLEDPCF